METDPFLEGIMKFHQGLEKTFHIYKWYDENKASMAKIAIDKYLQENKTFKFWTFLSFSVLLLLFSHSVTSRSLKPHGLQHVRLSCPSLYPRVCSDSCSLSWWCHPTISSSAAFLSFSLQSLPTPGVFFTWVGSYHVAKVLELQCQHQYFQWIFRVDFLQDWLLIKSSRIWLLTSNQKGFPFDLLVVHRTLKSLLQHHSLFSVFSLFFSVSVFSVTVC